MSLDMMDLEVGEGRGSGRHACRPAQRQQRLLCAAGLSCPAPAPSCTALPRNVEPACVPPAICHTRSFQVLKRSGTVTEQRYAAAIMPIVSNQHFLLVTLLLCNAVSMEALPLFLDRLADPVTAIAISVTAVLLFGEILPQAICTR